MGFLAFLVPSGLKEIARLVLTALLVAGMCLPLGYCKGQSAERARNAAARAEANVQAMRTNNAAQEAAATEALADAAEVSAHEEGLIDAIQSTPDGAPDAVRVALGCERLRRAGADTATLSECARPGGRSEAPAQR